MPDGIRSDVEKMEANVPHQYERRKPQYDNFLRWVGKVVMFQMCILIALLIGFWMKLDAIYNGNPNSDGKKMLCAILKDDAEIDPDIQDLYKELCDQFKSDLGGG